MIDGDFGPGFAIDLAHKDLSVVHTIAGQLRTCLPLARQFDRSYEHGAVNVHTRAQLRDQSR